MFDWNYWLGIRGARPAPRDSARAARQRAHREERTRIADSIGTFQLGEQSEGRTLLRFAREFGARHECPGSSAASPNSSSGRSSTTPRSSRVHARAWHRAQAAQLDGQHLPAHSPAGGIRNRGHHSRDRRDGRLRVLPRAGARDAEPYLRTICRQMCADEAIHLRYEAQLLRTLRGNAAAMAARLVEWPTARCCRWRRAWCFASIARAGIRGP